MDGEKKRNKMKKQEELKIGGIILTESEWWYVLEHLSQWPYLRDKIFHQLISQ
jgi:hypothetical protein